MDLKLQTSDSEEQLKLSDYNIDWYKVFDGIDNTIVTDLEKLN